MTYLDYETGTATGRPVELFEFNYGPNYYRYTSGTEAVVKSGATFLPASIQRDTLASSNDTNQSTLKISAHLSLIVAELFRVQPPSSVVTLTIFAQHLDDPDAQFATLWLGRVLNAQWSDNTVEFSCEPIDVSLKRNGLRRAYQRACPHVLYRSGCNVDPVTYRMTVTAGNFSVTDNTINVPALAAVAGGYYAGGYVEYNNPVTNAPEFYAIRWSAGTTLVLGVRPAHLAAALSLKLYPGCAHNTSDCKNKFNNLNNYGGMPHIPSLNPFGGTQLF